MRGRPAPPSPRPRRRPAGATRRSSALTDHLVVLSWGWGAPLVQLGPGPGPGVPSLTLLTLLLRWCAWSIATPSLVGKRFGPPPRPGVGPRPGCFASRGTGQEILYCIVVHASYVAWRIMARRPQGGGWGSSVEIRPRRRRVGKGAACDGGATQQVPLSFPGVEARPRGVGEPATLASPSPSWAVCKRPSPGRPWLPAWPSPCRSCRAGTPPSWPGSRGLPRPGCGRPAARRWPRCRWPPSPPARPWASGGWCARM